MKKNIIEEHTSDGPGTIIDRNGLVGLLGEKGEIIKPIIKGDALVAITRIMDKFGINQSALMEEL